MGSRMAAARVWGVGTRWGDALEPAKGMHPVEYAVIAAPVQRCPVLSCLVLSWTALSWTVHHRKCGLPFAGPMVQVKRL